MSSLKIYGARVRLLWDTMQGLYDAFPIKIIIINIIVISRLKSSRL